jgi:hypothetical protein
MMDYYDAGLKLKEKNSQVPEIEVDPGIEKVFKENEVDKEEIKRILEKIILFKELELITADELRLDYDEDKELGRVGRVEKIHYEIFPCFGEKIAFNHLFSSDHSELVACWYGDKVKNGERFNEDKIRAFILKSKDDKLSFLIEIFFPQKAWQHGQKISLSKDKNSGQMITNCINNLLKKGLGEESPQI